MAEKIIIIGGTAAGLSAASKAKRVNPALEITVFEKSGYISYGACGLPYFVGGLIEEVNELVSLTVREVSEKRGIPTFTHHEVIKIDRQKKSVLVKDLDNDAIQEHFYDKLVIATGAVPFKPSIEGLDTQGVYYLRTVEDGIALKKAVLLAGDPARAVVIGGGLIGLETVAELAGLGISVTLVEAGSRLLPFLEESFSAQIQQTLEQNGMTVLLNTIPEKILSQHGQISAVQTNTGVVLETDFLLVSAGVIPNTGLAEKAGLELGIRGAIRVNDCMQTSDPCIWACGDCAEVKNRITGKPAYIPLGTTANKQGRIAGDNLAGHAQEFPGVVGSMVTKVFDKFVACTGLSAEQATAEGYSVETSTITKLDRASYYPGGQDNTIRLIFDTDSGKLLGAQAIGSESVAGRVNVLATAITAGMTVSDLNELDLVYAPPVAPVYDPILIAASQALKKVKK